MSAASVPSSTQVWVVQNHTTGEVDLSDSQNATFALKSAPIPSSIPEDSLLVRVLYFGNDPAQRLWLQPVNEEVTKNRPEMRPISIGTPMRAYSAIARVVAVGSDGPDAADFHVGDIVKTSMDWSENAVVKKSGASKFESIPGVNPSAFLGALGASGQTAYWCLLETLQVKPSDTLVVSAAAGSVGNVAVQYAKNVLGVQRVVAIAGSEQKCRWLESIGADASLNYKSPTFVKDLKEATPKGVDKFFDNVGGWMLDEVIATMNPHGIVGIVGRMSLYNTEEGLRLKNDAMILLNRLTLKGYTVMDYIPRFPEAYKALCDAVVAGKLEVKGAETVVDIRGKFEEVPKVWAGLFKGANTGKLLTKVAD